MQTLDPSVAVPTTHIKCRQCGKDMPSTADRCPHCWRITKRKRVRQILFVAGALALLVLLVIGVWMK